ncbi:hypothetical protein B6V76_08265 [Thioclava sp. IC9]|nr:hypothetical protein B6V76_08265 [Thioclava sp. IC9]
MLAGNGKCPPARRNAQLMTSARSHRSRADAVLVAQVEAALPALAATHLLANRSVTMVRNDTAGDLTECLVEAATSEIASFPRGLVAAS